MNQARLPTVGILIFDEVEVLDFCGPFEVFSVARPVGENDDESKLFNVVTVAEEAYSGSWCMWWRVTRYLNPTQNDAL